MKRVDLEPIQDAVQAYVAEHSWKELCEALGWMESPTKPESARLQRALGLRKQSSSGKCNRQINSNTAVSIIRAIGRAPREFDL